MGVWLVAVVLGACGRGAPSNRSEAFALAETLAAGDTQLALHVAPSSTGLTPDARGGAV